MGLAQDGVGKPKVVGLLWVVVSRLHDPDMGQAAPGDIQAGDVDAILIALKGGEDPLGDALGGLPLAVAGEHAVDVSVVRRPEPPPHIHRGLVGAGNDQNAAPGAEGTLLLQFGQSLDQLGADVHLLDFVPTHGSHNGQTLLLRIAEVTALYQ